jgi:hypothetical protein
MPSTLRSKLAAIRTNLSRVGDAQPLHRAALVVVLLLDAFILVSILEGLDAHTSQLVSPWERFPPVCRDIVVEGSWNPTNRLERLDDAVHAYTASDLPPEQRRKPLHPICARVVEPIRAIQRDSELVRLLEIRRRHLAQTRDIDIALSGPKAAYDTALLEKVAKEGEGGPEVAAIRKELREKTAALNTARIELAAADAALDRSPRIAALWEQIQGLREEDRRQLTSDLRRMSYWFPVKRLAMQLAFLLPLFAAFWAWNSASIRRRRGVQTLVSSHLLVVAFLPILVEIVEAVYDVLPKRLLKAVLDLLVSWNLAGLWHYVLIALAVAVALFVVHVVQKKVFSQERLLERRIAKGHCQACGRPLPHGARACVFCGFAQFTVCSGCGGLAHVHGRHCCECGRELPVAPGEENPQIA